MPTNRFDRWELFLSLTIPLVGAWVGGCGGSRGASPEEVQEHLDDVVVPLVDDSMRAFEMLDDSEALQNVQDALASTGALSFEDDEEMEEWEEPIEEEVDPNEPTAGEEMARFLRERIFTEDNYEGDGVFLIGGEDVCEQSVVDGSDMEAPEPQVDSECVEMVDDAEIRIEVLLVDGGIDASLLVGPDRARPAKLESRDDRFTVVSDLGESARAIEHLAEIADEPVDLPDVLEGVLAMTLRQDGEQAATIQMEIREAIAVEVGTEDGDYSLHLEAADPLAFLSVDGIERRIEIGLQAGRIQASFPWGGLFAIEQEGDTIAEEPPLEGDDGIEGTLRIDIAGATGSIVATDGDGAVRFEGVGLGDDTSSIALDDATIWSMDVNPEDGRTFDLEVTAEDGVPRIAIDPLLHVRTTVDLRPITPADEEIDPAADGDTYEVRFDGDSPTAEVVETADGEGLLRVVSGRLTVTASGEEPVVVEAGECLLEVETVEGTETSTDMQAGACE